MAIKNFIKGLPPWFIGIAFAAVALSLYYGSPGYIIAVIIGGCIIAAKRFLFSKLGEAGQQEDNKAQPMPDGY